ncbi:carboxypeptidase M32 [Algicella marina]|uniref:Metal-dependent carboxypeptidase n=1 Tax=Algicella marina TaxID=2683284 RepID=A0A6P1T3N3_9RHOB|nr:carboxypeptidase M32 [Algicella marina]QHQ36086.1 carboxypeptidase M32 [Algicella marina]
MAETYETLLAHTARSMALDEVAGLLAWDQETVMPVDGGFQREEHAAALEEARHSRNTDPRIGEWLASLEGATLSPEAARNVELIRRRYTRATAVPADLSIAIARQTSAGQRVWAEARRTDDFNLFAPALTRIVELKREEAQHRRLGTGPLYDALLDGYEPGMTTATLTPLFERLRGPLADLRAEIAERGIASAKLKGHFPEKAQLAFAHALAEVFGYNLKAGRIDTAVHPFSSGSGRDVRITTRVAEDDPAGNIFSTIHEMGHAVYEQNIERSHNLQPIGAYASMGVHESQSRLFENQIGRSRAFAEYLYPAMREAFGDLCIDGPAALFAALNHVETGFIRTEADEVHYNLHVILRYNLEQDVIEGRLDVADLQDAWNQRFEQDFGRKVPSAAQGVLQDVHWSVGHFGYFPTYTLGNIYAGELFAAMQSALPDLDAEVARGDLTNALNWLHINIHRPGASLPPEDLVSRVIGRAPTEAPLISYLQAKFRGLYAT